MRSSDKAKLDGMSHPSWVCGLKLAILCASEDLDTSHPSWVCGLKLVSINVVYLHTGSHPSWVCGLKHVILDLYGVRYEVTPFVGVWIETLTIIR